MTQSESHQALGLRGPSFYNTLIFASDNADRWALIREAGSLKKKAKYFRETGNHVESLTCDGSIDQGVSLLKFAKLDAKCQLLSCAGRLLRHHFYRT